MPSSKIENISGLLTFIFLSGLLSAAFLISSSSSIKSSSLFLSKTLPLAKEVSLSTSTKSFLSFTKDFYPEKMNQGKILFWAFNSLNTLATSPKAV